MVLTFRRRRYKKPTRLRVDLFGVDVAVAVASGERCIESVCVPPALSMKDKGVSKGGPIHSLYTLPRLEIAPLHMGGSFGGG